MRHAILPPSPREMCQSNHVEWKLRSVPLNLWFANFQVPSRQHFPRTTTQANKFPFAPFLSTRTFISLDNWNPDITSLVCYRFLNKSWNQKRAIDWLEFKSENEERQNKGVIYILALISNSSTILELRSRRAQSFPARSWNYSTTGVPDRTIHCISSYQ